MRCSFMSSSRQNNNLRRRPRVVEHQPQALRRFSACSRSSWMTLQVQTMLWLVVLVPQVDVVRLIRWLELTEAEARSRCARSFRRLPPRRRASTPRRRALRRSAGGWSQLRCSMVSSAVPCKPKRRCCMRMNKSSERLSARARLSGRRRVPTSATGRTVAVLPHRVVRLEPVLALSPLARMNTPAKSGRASSSGSIGALYSTPRRPFYTAQSNCAAFQIGDALLLHVHQGIPVVVLISIPMLPEQCFPPTTRHNQSTEYHLRLEVFPGFRTGTARRFCFILRAQPSPPCSR